MLESEWRPRPWRPLAEPLPPSLWALLRVILMTQEEERRKKKEEKEEAIELLACAPELII